MEISHYTLFDVAMVAALTKNGGSQALDKWKSGIRFM